VRTLSSFLRRKVVSEAGRKLGYCHDLRGELSAGGLEVTGCASGALVEHFGLRAHSRHDEVPWSKIVRIEADRIIVRDEV
jgi:sporulation protein YlmC with PRC-barrel domain